MGKPVPKIGVDMLYYAKVLSDAANGTTYDTPVWLQGVNSIGYNPNTQTQTYDADDGTYDVYSADGNIQLSIELANLTPANRAALLGLTINAYGEITEGRGDNAPEVAIMFRAQKSNGEYQFVTIYKGKFAKGEESFTTKGGNGITYNATALTMNVMNRISDGAKRHLLDSDAEGCTKTVAELSSTVNGWFSSPNYSVGNATNPVNNLAAATGATTSGTIALTWTAVSDATKIIPQVSQNGSQWTDLTEVQTPASAASYTCTGLTAGATYICRLAVIGGVKAGYSNLATAAAKS